MKTEDLSEVIDCLPKGKTHYRYYKGAYAPQLLSLLIDEEVSVRALKTTNLKPLLSHPLVKSLAAQSGSGKLKKKELEAVWREPSEPFLLTLSRWGGKTNRSWYQTSRYGENLVLQLNMPVEHQRKYHKYIDDSGANTLNGRFSAHPVQRPANNHSFRETLAWSRIDFDFEQNEALIEEVQSDAVRYVLWWERKYKNCGCARCLTRLNYIRWMGRYKNIWSEAMLMATIKFIAYDLGISRIYYHTDRSGWQVKRMDKNWRAPKSLYSDLPKRFAFEQTWAAPEFLLKERSYQQLIRTQPDIDFFCLNMSKLRKGE